MAEPVIVLMVALPALATVAALLLCWRGAPGSLVSRVAVGMTGAAFLVALGATALAWASPAPLETPRSPVHLDPLTAALALLVLGLSTVIQSFASRYLRGDNRQNWFVASTTAVTAATTLMVSAASVVTFVVGWVGAGAALLAALATYPQLEQAREGVRRTAIRFAVGDGAVVAAAVALLVAAGGDTALSEIGAVAARLPEPVAAVVAAMLVVGALARSSQVPFHGWLPVTLAAPTPVSALMHAGVVNAGAILLVRFSGVISVHLWLMVAVAGAGIVTLLWASAVRLVRPDIKGRLAYSTMAQMGFMIMACGIGAYGAALFHLIAHSLFKSSLFLGAGSGVSRYLQRLDQPVDEPARGGQRIVAVVVAIVVPAGALALAESALQPSIPLSTAALLGFVAVAGGVAIGSLLLRRFTAGMLVLAVTGTVALALAYSSALLAFSAVLGLEPAASPAPAWVVGVAAAGLVLIEVLRRPGRSRLRDRAYTRALSATTRHPLLSKGSAR